MLELVRTFTISRNPRITGDIHLQCAPSPPAIYSEP
jgi:hypothetical protein